MPAIRHDDILLRLIKDVNDIRSTLRRVTVNFPLFDIDNENTPEQITATQNNYVPGNYDVLRLSSDRIVSITGMRGGIKGRKMRLFNVGNYSILIPHQSFSSNAENRFKLQGGKDAVYLTSVEPNTNMEFYYDETLERWLTIAAPPAYDIGEDWEAIDAPVFTFDVCWSEDLQLFVAVGNGTCITSPDGETWTERTISTDVWTGIIWSSIENKFFSISSESEERVASSSNGINWSQINSAWTAEPLDDSYGWISIAWSPDLGLFCAVGINAVATSPDGEVWTNRTPASASTWQDICWSPDLGLFCAVGNGVVMTSPDGITWTTRAPAAANDWEGVCWSPDLTLFVAVSFDGANRAMTSPDGITWTIRVTPTTGGSQNSWTSVVWSSDLTLFCACAFGSVTNERIMTSPDGITWTIRNLGAGLGLQDVCWSPDLGIFLAVGSNYYAISANGIDWTVGTIRTTGSLQFFGVCWSTEQGLFVTVAASGDQRRVSYSSDGTTWHERSDIGLRQWNEICWSSGLGLFCAVASTGSDNRAMITDDPTITHPWNCESLATNGIVFVAVGDNYAFYSIDGDNWQESTIPPGTYNDVCWSSEKNIFVAVGNSNICATSSDGITWTSRTISNGTWNGVAWAPELGLFVACSSATNYISTSPDGITWTARSATAGTWNELVWCPEITLLIVIGTDSSMVSADGINYTVATTVISGTWSGIAWSNELSVAAAVANAGANKVMKAP